MQIPTFSEFSKFTWNAEKTHKLKKVFHRLFQLPDALAHFNIVEADLAVNGLSPSLAIVRMAIVIGECLHR
jgi:hypothetical protein